MIGEKQHRILVLEDEFLLALELEQILQDAGLHVVGPFARFDDALDAMRCEKINAALLDVNVAGQPSTPLAAKLIADAIPFALVTGYDAQELPPEFAGRPLVAKPYEPRDILDTIRKLVGGAG